MIGIEEFKEIISELLDELPAPFFRDLTGGVIVSEATTIPNYAQGDDLYTMGQYQIFSGVRQVIIYKGSFDRAYPNVGADEARTILRGVIRHEFRHHMEFISGIHDETSLEAEDQREKQKYLLRHLKNDHL